MEPKDIKDIAHIMRRYLRANYPGIYTVEIEKLALPASYGYDVQFQDSINSEPKPFISLCCIQQFCYYYYNNGEKNTKMHVIHFSDFAKELKDPPWKNSIDENWPLFVKDYLGSDLKYAFFFNPPSI